MRFRSKTGKIVEVAVERKRIVCTGCGGTVLVEDVGDGKTKRVCQGCGVSEVRDDSGRRMLTDERQTRGHRLEESRGAR